ncbi:hypothetical protein TRFO_37985 [Tritrichomonas foetus]|uniref:Uncharacterized protein n=1 Tax=Tritrichomonas foetus TaxID=1144522 RepID=A0A1J4JCD3_9EUKA|nr:hypothetical protein TRFO_37985 [Tritrichomonas foetus]|eukprot:OHS95911.1 hypothetical protein TRFO_37985 [Tritrichomonas foetus]
MLILSFNKIYVGNSWDCCQKVMYYVFIHLIDLNRKHMLTIEYRLKEKGTIQSDTYNSILQAPCIIKSSINSISDVIHKNDTINFQKSKITKEVSFKIILYDISAGQKYQIPSDDDSIMIFFKLEYYPLDTISTNDLFVNYYHEIVNMNLNNPRQLCTIYYSCFFLWKNHLQYLKENKKDSSNEINKQSRDQQLQENDQKEHDLNIKLKFQLFPAGILFLVILASESEIKTELEPRDINFNQNMFKFKDELEMNFLNDNILDDNNILKKELQDFLTDYIFNRFECNEPTTKTSDFYSLINFLIFDTLLKDKRLNDDKNNSKISQIIKFIYQSLAKYYVFDENFKNCFKLECLKFCNLGNDFLDDVYKILTPIENSMKPPVLPFQKLSYNHEYLCFNEILVEVDISPERLTSTENPSNSTANQIMISPYKGKLSFRKKYMLFEYQANIKSAKHFIKIPYQIIIEFSSNEIKAESDNDEVFIGYRTNNSQVNNLITHEHANGLLFDPEDSNIMMNDNRSYAIFLYDGSNSYKFHYFTSKQKDLIIHALEKFTGNTEVNYNILSNRFLQEWKSNGMYVLQKESFNRAITKAGRQVKQALDRIRDPRFYTLPEVILLMNSCMQSEEVALNTLRFLMRVWIWADSKDPDEIENLIRVTKRIFTPAVAVSSKKLFNELMDWVSSLKDHPLALRGSESGRQMNEMIRLFKQYKNVNVHQILPTKKGEYFDIEESKQINSLSQNEEAP